MRADVGINSSELPVSFTISALLAGTPLMTLIGVLFLRELLFCFSFSSGVTAAFH